MSSLFRALPEVTSRGVEAREASRLSPSPQPPSSTRSSPRPEHRYDVADEAPPEGVFSRPAVQQAMSDSRSLTRRLSEILARVGVEPGSSTTLSRYADRAKRLAAMSISGTRRVGLVGDSGVGTFSLISHQVYRCRMNNLCVGKSRLLNSLLDMEGFARAVSLYQ